MMPTLDIILPVRRTSPGLLATVASLAAQTDRQFGVVLGDGLPAGTPSDLEAAEKQFSDAGIPVRRLHAPCALDQLEYWNWLHAEARAAWLKPLLPGQRLQPRYVERLKESTGKNERAHLIRCDIEIRTDWGVETVRAPYTQAWLESGELLNHFPARVDWIANLANVAYTRLAWSATGGFDVHFPVCAPLNLNVLLAMRHGLANIPEVLAHAGPAVSLNATPRGRVNLWLELWLMMRQLRNGCLAAKQPWPSRGVWLGVTRGQAMHRESD
jgi:hypothetical protein